MERKLRRSIFFRSFLIQAGWNFERMQNIGFAFAIYPALAAVYKGRELGRAVVRHLEMFNTQPFMASFALGFTAKLEEEAAKAAPEEKPALEEKIRSGKCAISSPTAAIGDRLFWGTLRPYSLAITLLVWWLFGVRHWTLPIEMARGERLFSTYGAVAIFFGVAVGLAAYNSAALWIRWKGLKYGYNCASSNSCGIDFFDWQKLIKHLRWCGFISAVLVAVLKCTSFMSGVFSFGQTRQAWTLMAVAPVAFIAAFVVRRRGIPGMYLYAAIIAAASAALYGVEF